MRSYDCLPEEDYYSDTKSLGVDFNLKLVAVKVSSAVVRLDSYTDSSVEDDKVHFDSCSGTVISCDKADGDDGGWVATILTSADIVAAQEVKKVKVCWGDGMGFESRVDAFDMHYNVALVKVHKESPVSTAVLHGLNVVDPATYPLLSRHSYLCNIHLGDTVIALGRVYNARASFVASFGEFSTGQCGFDRHELLWSTCEVYPVQLGGPLINGDGVVIGVNFEGGSFLPINIISRCLGHLEKHRKLNHPHLGMQLTSPYEVTLETFKEITLKFPDISVGVIVGAIQEGSAAHRAGIHEKDVIAECDGVKVMNSLRLSEILWDKTHESIELVVKRASVGETIKILMAVNETSPNEFYRWPIGTVLSKTVKALSRKRNEWFCLPQSDDDMDLDLVTKSAADKISPSIVSLVSYRGDDRNFVCSGLIFHHEERDGLYASSILTSASLLGEPFNDIPVVPIITKVEVVLFDGRELMGDILTVDFHYNIAVILIRSPDRLPTASPNLSRVSLGDKVIALGRCSWSKLIVASTGVVSTGHCNFDCQELWEASCRITSVCVGGPIINVDGEVLGMNFYDFQFTPFLPLNIVFSCLDQLKIHRSIQHPWIGASVIGLHAADVGRLERIIHKLSEVSNGLLVDKVVVQSPAHIAGILPHDVIVQCGQEVVGCPKKFFQIIFDKAGEDIELTVIRESEDAPLSLTLHVADKSPHGNRWPIPGRRKRSRV